MGLFKKFKEEPVYFLFQKMWRFAEGHRGYVVLYMAMSLISNLFLLSQPLIFGKFLNEIQINGFGDHNINFLVLILLSLVAIELGFWLFHGPSRIIENTMAFKTDRNYKNYLLSGTLDLEMSWHSQRDSGDTIDKVNKASDGLYDFSKHTFNIIRVIVSVIGTTAVLMFFNLYIGIMALSLLIIAFLIIYQFDKKLVPQYKKLNKYDNKISARIFDSLSNIVTVKVLNIEKPIFQNLKKSLWSPFELFRKNIRLIEVKWFTGSTLFNLLAVVPVLFYILFIYKNNMVLQIGIVSAMYIYLANLIDVYYTFAGQYEDMIINKTKILNAKEIEDSFETSEKKSKNLSDKWQKIELKNVVFAYADEVGESKHVDEVDFEFKRGEKIALIGESGSGKSTFLKVIHGLYAEASAKLFFDGNEIVGTKFSEIDLKSTLVPQEPEVFSASIRENITLDLDYKDEVIMSAARLAEFDGVIEQLPRGMESVINEKGVNLSGGQKQRLALTRALLFSSQKDLILLDESTSSVDPENENKIYQNIFNYFKGRTIIASIHKMNLLKYFDKIFIFDKGKIVDQGSFEDLLKRNKKFKEDWESYIATH